MTTLQPPRGTHDLLYPASDRAAKFEAEAARLAELSGFRRIVTPMFEDTALFHRGIGEGNDVVAKETYDFLDRGGNRLTLRPEGTAPVMRAIVSNKLWDDGLPIKVQYTAAMFRYERPQKGRVRQHHQVGVEAVGGEEASLDADVIALGWDILAAAGVGSVLLRLNSMGDRECRAAYIETFVSALRPRAAELSEDSQRRLEVNPLRIWDSKIPGDQEILADAPTLADALCDDCATHLHAVRAYLDEWGIPYAMTPGLVRGFDYYTRTTFEFQSQALDAAQNALGGGGRYDGLVEAIGGPSLPGVGFGIGVERVLLAQEAAGTVADVSALDCYVIPLREEDVSHALSFTRAARAAGIRTDLAHRVRGLKAQMKQANKLSVRAVALIGEQEAAAGAVTLRDMTSGEQQTLSAPAAIEQLTSGGTHR